MVEEDEGGLLEVEGGRGGGDGSSEAEREVRRERREVRSWIVVVDSVVFDGGAESCVSPRGCE